VENESASYILFDIPAGKRPEHSEFMESLGHPVMVCHGPAEGTVCPILAGEGCDLAEGAHGVVFELDLDLAKHRAILDSYKTKLRSDVPIGVVVRPGQAEEYATLLGGIKVWDHIPAAGDLDWLAASVDASDL
jgi:hypothetical protein